MCARFTLNQANSPLGNQQVSRAGGFPTIKVPHKQFAALVDNTAKLTEFCKKSKQNWLIRVPLAKDMAYKIQHGPNQLKVALMKKTCASLAKKVIVIDPGHGGKDPGAIGANHSKEKVITLAIAKKLKQRFAKDPHYAVYLTREKDEYIPLRERILRAQKHNPDVFISMPIQPRKGAKACLFMHCLLLEPLLNRPSG